MKVWMAAAMLILVAACVDGGGDDDTGPPQASAATSATTVPPQAATTVPPQAATTVTTAPGDTTTTTSVDELTGGIEGVQVFDGLLNTHTDEDVDYDVRPPAGGIHAPIWLPCAPYDDEVIEEEAVHSLEHGAVWVTYDLDAIGDAGKDELLGVIVQAFEDEPGRLDYVLLSPYPEMPSPVVASAWGRQLVLTGVDDPRLTEFLQYFTSGPQTPEPGAPC